MLDGRNCSLPRGIGNNPSFLMRGEEIARKKRGEKGLGGGGGGGGGRQIGEGEGRMKW